MSSLEFRGVTYPKVEEQVKPADPPVRKGRPGSAFEFEGRTYSSITDFCSIWKLKLPLISKYRRKHPELSLEDVLKYYLNKKDGVFKRRGSEFVYEGVYYESAKDFCRRHGRYEAYMSHVQLKHPDWSRDQLCAYVVATPTQTRYKHHVEYKGEVFTSIEKFSVRLGLSKCYFYKLKQAHSDWTYDRLIEYMKYQAEMHAKKLPKVDSLKTDKKEESVAEVEPVITAIPSNSVVETTVPKNVDPAIEQLRAWRLAGQRTKMELVGATDMSAFKAWKDTAVESVLKSGPIYPDKVNAPWLKIDDVESVIDQACADVLEIAYLVVVHKVDLMKAINLCRADTELDNPSQEELDRLQAEVKSLRESVDSLYCKDCGDLIAPQFSEAHPGTCYCQRCYDKHNSD